MWILEILLDGANKTKINPSNFYLPKKFPSAVNVASRRERNTDNENTTYYQLKTRELRKGV